LKDLEGHDGITMAAATAGLRQHCEDQSIYLSGVKSPLESHGQSFIQIMLGYIIDRGGLIMDDYSEL
jgi:hypothetical protein